MSKTYRYWYNDLCFCGIWCNSEEQSEEHNDLYRVEVSYLEPDERFGMGYLEVVRDVFLLLENIGPLKYPWKFHGKKKE